MKIEDYDWSPMGLQPWGNFMMRKIDDDTVGFILDDKMLVLNKQEAEMLAACLGSAFSFELMRSKKAAITVTVEEAVSNALDNSDGVEF